jgi:hypothetical protein
MAEYFPLQIVVIPIPEPLLELFDDEQADDIP